MVFSGQYSSTTPSMGAESVDAELLIQKANAFDMQILHCAGFGNPNPLIVQGSGVQACKTCGTT